MHVRKQLLKWYRANKRTFLWRSSNVTPYVVMISETMLQQTQTSRVQERLPSFLKRFPTLHKLAKATNAEMIQEWEGMGYNSRAIRLRDAARVLVEKFNAEIPNDVTALRALPGFGPYTSAAVVCFAFNTRTVVIDVNIRRVYSRIFQPQQTTVSVLPDSDVIAIAESIIPQKNSSEWHHAVMDLGATICTARAPKCNVCCVATLCASANRMQQVTVRKKEEPSFRGIPNRLWRGRIVQVLRSNPVLHKDELFALVDNLAIQPHEELWYVTILNALEKSQIISVNNEIVQLVH